MKRQHWVGLRRESGKEEVSAEQRVQEGGAVARPGGRGSVHWGEATVFGKGTADGVVTLCHT